MLPRETEDEDEYGTLFYSLEHYEKKPSKNFPELNIKRRLKRLPPPKPAPQLTEEEKQEILEQQSQNMYYGEVKKGVVDYDTHRMYNPRVNFRKEPKKVFFERLPKILAAAHLEKTVITPIFPHKRENKRVGFGENSEITTEQLDKKKKRSVLDTSPNVDFLANMKDDRIIDPFTKFMSEEELIIFNHMRFKTYSTTSMKKLRKRFEENTIR
jgi:hypothetical protein